MWRTVFQFMIVATYPNNFDSSAIGLSPNLRAKKDTASTHQHGGTKREGGTAEDLLTPVEDEMRRLDSSLVAYKEIIMILTKLKGALEITREGVQALAKTEYKSAKNDQTGADQILRIARKLARKNRTSKRLSINATSSEGNIADMLALATDIDANYKREMEEITQARQNAERNVIVVAAGLDCVDDMLLETTHQKDALWDRLKGLFELWKDEKQGGKLVGKEK